MVDLDFFQFEELIDIKHRRKAAQTTNVIISNGSGNSGTVGTGKRRKLE